MNTHTVYVRDLGRIEYRQPFELMERLRATYPIEDCADWLAVYGTPDLADYAHGDTEREIAPILLALTEGNNTAIWELLERDPARAAVWANQWVLATRHLATMFRDHLTRRTLEQMTAKLRDPS